MNLKQFLVVFVTGAFSVLALASSDDMQQPIHIEADRADIDEAKGVMTYTGNVQLRQGGIEMTADTVVVYSKDGELQRIAAQGTPVHYLQKPLQDAQQKEVRGVSQRMEYSASSKLVLLLGKAELWQDGNRFSGNRIQYDPQTERVVANAGSGADAGQRVSVTIQPKKKKAASQTGDAQKDSAKP